MGPKQLWFCYFRWESQPSKRRVTLMLNWNVATFPTSQTQQAKQNSFHPTIKAVHFSKSSMQHNTMSQPRIQS